MKKSTKKDCSCHCACEPTQEQIKIRAQEVYMRTQVAGRDVENWLQAEAELRAELTQHAKA